MKTFLFFLSGLTLTLAGLAQPGSVYTPFANNGFLIQNEEFMDSEPVDFGFQNSKIIVLGSFLKQSSTSYYNSMFVVRLNADGSLDKTFGIGGLVEASQPAYSYTPATLYIHTNGDIYVAGTRTSTSSGDNAAILWKVDDDGSLVSNFGTNGILRIFGSTLSTATDMEVNNSQIYFCGAKVTSPSTVLKPYVACTDLNGILNTAFNGTGIQVVDYNGASGEFSALDYAPQSGRIYATGGAGSKMAVAVITASSGLLYTSFDTDGKLDFDYGSPGDNEYARDIAYNAGRINICGYSNGEPIVVQLNPNGSFDLNFNGFGKLTIPFGGSFNQATSLTINASNDIIISVSVPATNVARVIAIQPNTGLLQPGFGLNGIKDLNFNPNSGPNPSKIYYKNGTVFALYTTTGMGVSDDSPGIYAMDEDYGTDVNFFGGAEKFVTAVRQSEETYCKVYLQNQNLLALKNTENIQYNFRKSYVDRFLPDGTPDTSFHYSYSHTANARGVQLLVNPDFSFFVLDYIVDPNSSQTTWRIYKHQPDGALDLTFGNAGSAQIATGLQHLIPYGFMQLSDGSLVAYGHKFTVNGEQSYAWKTTPSGGNDVNFDGDGLWASPVPNNTSLDLMAGFSNSAGNIVLAGYFKDEINDVRDVVFITLAPDGSQIGNTTFAGLQESFTAYPGSTSFLGITALPDNRFYLTAYFNDNGLYGTVVARYYENLSFDTGFGNGGYRKFHNPAYLDIPRGATLTPENQLVFLTLNLDTNTHPLYGYIYKSVLHRLDSLGNYDTGFSFDGKALLQSSPSKTQLESVLAHPNGLLYSAGLVQITNDMDYLLCAVESNLQTVQTETLAPESGYSVFPNPVNGTTLNLRTKYTNENPVTISWLNAQGQTGGILYTGAVPHQLALQLPELPAGMYLLKIETGADTQYIRFMHTGS